MLQESIRVPRHVNQHLVEVAQKCHHLGSIIFPPLKNSIYLIIQETKSIK